MEGEIGDRLHHLEDNAVLGKRVEEGGKWVTLLKARSAGYGALSIQKM